MFVLLVVTLLIASLTQDFEESESNPDARLVLGEGYSGLVADYETNN